MTSRPVHSALAWMSGEHILGEMCVQVGQATENSLAKYGMIKEYAKINSSHKGTMFRTKQNFCSQTDRCRAVE